MGNCKRPVCLCVYFSMCVNARLLKCFLVFCFFPPPSLSQPFQVAILKTLCSGMKLTLLRVLSTLMRHYRRDALQPSPQKKKRESHGGKCPQDLTLQCSLPFSEPSAHINNTRESKTFGRDFARRFILLNEGNVTFPTGFLPRLSVFSLIHSLVVRVFHSSPSPSSSVS